MLAGEFPTATAAQWRAAVDRVLAGRDADLSEDELARRFRRQLETTTYDGITVQPLFTRIDPTPPAVPVGVPGRWPYVRGGTTTGGLRSGWDVRQAVDLEEVPASGASAALEHLEQGATSLLLRSDARDDGHEPVLDVDLLDHALDGVYLDLISVALGTDLGTGAAEALLALFGRRGLGGDTATGVLGLDPIGAGLSHREATDRSDLPAAVEVAVRCAGHWPRVRPLVVDATRYHEAGASDTEELACATAAGVAYLRLLVDAGLDLVPSFRQLEFRMAATADQFSTLVKLRASRLMWGRVAEALGVPDAGGQRQHALTSRAMLSRYDPWVNLLRNTAACFGAGAGGADAITVEPHDLLVDPRGPTELGRRLARNTQLLLLEETHLARVLDPGGGSWYVEWLTEAMAQRAWEWFQEIEAAGGMSSPAGAALVRDRIDATWSARRDRLARRADILVGVNDFPNLEDQVPPDGPAEPGRGLARRRYGADFEALRERTDRYERTSGSRPGVLLVRLGPASASTARATYAKAFFETAGLRTAFHDVGDPLAPDELSRALADSGTSLACLCSSDAVYAERGVEAAAALATSGAARAYAAARPGEVGDALVGAGIDELVYAGCNVLEALLRALGTGGVP